MSKFEALHGQISGTGTQPILLSHGFGTDQSAWNAIRPWLDARFRVHSYDLAGAGPNGSGTYDPRRHNSLYGYADDLVEVIDELELDGCIYIGHSVSGMVGAAASLNRPTAFERMVMIGASARYRNDENYLGGFEQAQLDGLFDAMAANFQAWGAGFAPAVVGAPDGDAIRAFSRTLFLMRPDVALASARTIFQSDMRSIVGHVTSPVHLLQVRRDMAVPMETAVWLHENMPASTLDIIDAEGHLPHMTAPDAVIGILAKYMD